MTYYEAVKAALLPLNVPLYHNKALKQDGAYIVWSEATTSGVSVVWLPDVTTWFPSFRAPW